MFEQTDQIWHSLAELQWCAHVPNFVHIGLYCRHWKAKTTNFTSFSSLASCDGATYRRGDKVERRYTTTNYSLSNDIKIISNIYRSTPSRQISPPWRGEKNLKSPSPEWFMIPELALAVKQALNSHKVLKVTLLFGISLLHAFCIIADLY